MGIILTPFVLIVVFFIVYGWYLNVRTLFLWITTGEFAVTHPFGLLQILSLVLAVLVAIACCQTKNHSKNGHKVIR